MSVQTNNSKSPSSLTINQLIGIHPDLASYFSKSSQPHLYQDLAIQLIREAINARSTKEKHYHVAYVKHNRFLSPSQKQEVSPKITEVIPISPEPIKIYGKPKVKLDDQFSKDQYTSQSPISPSAPATQICLQEQTYPKQINQGNATHEEVKQSEIQSEKYLSPRSSKQLQIQSRHQLGYSTKPPVNKEKIKEKQRIKDKELQKRQNYIKKIQQTQQNPMTKQNQIFKNGILSPKKGCGKIERYDNVDSKIKFLIDRDKNNKKIERELEYQNKKISELEKRQEKLLIRQYEQKKIIEKQRQSVHELGCCCCSSDEEITNQLLKIRGKMNDRDYKSTLSKIKKRLQPSNKLYKINSNPIYPITSSSESNSSSQDIVVTGIY